MLEYTLKICCEWLSSYQKFCDTDNACLLFINKINNQEINLIDDSRTF